LSSWGWLTCNEQVIFLQSWAGVFFITITVRVSLNLSYFNKLFLWRYDGEFLYSYIFIIARENSCKIGRAPYSVRLISYNAGRAPYDVVRSPIGHRPMFSYTDAGRHPYDIWPRKIKFLKIVRCPGDYQICRWCANRWNRKMSVLFVTVAYRYTQRRNCLLDVWKKFSGCERKIYVGFFSPCSSVVDWVKIAATLYNSNVSKYIWNFII